MGIHRARLGGCLRHVRPRFYLKCGADSGKPRPWIEVARQPFVAYFLMWGLIATSIVVFLCNRFPIERRNWPPRFLLHLALSIVLGILISLARLPLHSFVYPASDERAGWMMFKGYFFTNGFDDITMYWAVACICFSWLYYQRAKDREIQASALEAQLARAHLEALKMQLHPHFLFNTLHSISELMHQDVSCCRSRDCAAERAPASYA